MRPTLFHLFGTAVPSYAVFMALGYLAALYIAARQLRRVEGLERSQLLDLYLMMLLSSLLGSKIGHVLFESPGHKLPGGRVATSMFELLAADPWHWLRLEDAGYVWYGGLVGALLTAIVYFRRRPTLNAWRYADALAPAIAFGAIFGRLGCLLAGCCHGRPSDVAWAMQFATTSVPVHPTQIYDALAALALFVPLYLRAPKRRFDGEAIAALLIGYSLLRALTEAFRGDAERGAFGPISTSQLISIPLFFAGLWIWRARGRAGIK